ncbi:MAG: hypothetical protein AAB557_04960 [Patescibacteria group bacterium]
MGELENYFRHLKYLEGSLPILAEKYIGQRASFDQSRFSRNPDPAITEGTIEAIELVKAEEYEELFTPYLRATIRVSPTTSHLVDLDVVTVAGED